MLDPQTLIRLSEETGFTSDDTAGFGIEEEVDTDKDPLLPGEEIDPEELEDDLDEDDDDDHS